MTVQTVVTGNTASLHFPYPLLGQYVDNKKGGAVEMIFTDGRFDNTVFSEESISRQLVSEVNKKLRAANVICDLVSKPTIIGKGYNLVFRKIDVNGKINEPSFTWRCQLVMSLAPKLAIYGYEFTGEAAGADLRSSFYFVEKKTVLDDLLGPSSS